MATPRGARIVLTITTTHSPATDLGYLLHKNPASFQTVTLPFGQAHVFQEEEAVEERVGLNRQRLATVLSTLKELGARRVLDLGCGEGRLLRLLIDDRSFEWRRDQFAGWADAVAGRHGYSVRFDGIGPADPTLGTPTQMAVFTR